MLYLDPLAWFIIFWLVFILFQLGWENDGGSVGNFRCANFCMSFSSFWLKLKTDYYVKKNQSLRFVQYVPNLSRHLVYFYLFIAIFDHYKQHLVLLGLSSPFPIKWRPANRKCIPTSGQLCTFSSSSILTPLECKTRHNLVSEKHFLCILSILCPRHLPPLLQLLVPVILFCSNLPGYMTLPSLLKSPSLYLSMAWG